MRAHPFKIPRTSNCSIGTQVDHLAHFYDIFHQHPEIQVTLIKESTGTLFLGDYIGDFKPGDCFIIGANVPHVFKNDKEYYESIPDKNASAFSVFFDENSLGRGFFELPESWRMKDLIFKTRRGLRIGKALAAKVGPLIEDLFSLKDLDKLIAFLGIIKVLCESEDLHFLTREAKNHDVDEADGKRLNDIFQFTMNEFSREIQLDEVAEIASMTRSSFCRYFKNRTRKTYLDFLIEVRISHACKLLQTKDWSIAEISERCGFNNHSNFNRHFKRSKGFAPSKFKRKSIAEMIF